MSARTFNADTDDEEDGHPQARNDGECSHQTVSDSQADEQVQQPTATKKHYASEQREWTEMNRWDRNDSTDEEILVFIRGISTNSTAVLEFCIFRDRTRIAKTNMDIFNSGAVGPAAMILSRILLQTVLYLGNAGVNVRRKLSKRQCRQFCPSLIRTQLQIIFPRKTRPNIFHISK